MKKLQLRDQEVTLFLKAASRTSGMAGILMAAIMLQVDRDDERLVESLNVDVLRAMEAIQAHREVENMPRGLSGIDFVNQIVESNTLASKLEGVFKTARLDTDILIEVRDPRFKGSEYLDVAIKEFNLKTGLNVTVAAHGAV